jgi:hypothetical protein
MLITPGIARATSWELRADTEGAIRVSTHVPGVDRVGLLRFDLTDIIERPVTVLEAELVFGVLGPAGHSGEIQVGTMLTRWMTGPLGWAVPWAEPGLQSDADHEPVRTLSLVTPSDGTVLRVKLDVLDDLQRWLSGRLENFGWRVSGTVRFGSVLNVIRAARPTLSVKYSEDVSAAVGAGISAGGF